MFQSESGNPGMQAETQPHLIGRRKKEASPCFAGKQSDAHGRRRAGNAPPLQPAAEKTSATETAPAIEAKTTT